LTTASQLAGIGGAVTALAEDRRKPWRFRRPTVRNFVRRRRIDGAKTAKNFG
jgi:hypothetical protein